MIVCPVCGTEHSDHEWRCAECGKDLVEEVDDQPSLRADGGQCVADTDRVMPRYPDVDGEHVDPKAAWLRFASAQLEKAAKEQERNNWQRRDDHVSEAFVGLEEARGTYEHLEGLLAESGPAATDTDPSGGADDA